MYANYVMFVLLLFFLYNMWEQGRW